MTLFIGGPADGREIEIQGLPNVYRVVVPTSPFCASDREAGTEDFLYRRVRFANRKTEQIRSVFAPVDMHLYEAERQLIDHVMGLWIKAVPDERKIAGEK